jgi:hypothetical protein
MVEIDEYITACYGTTEYPEDMTGITLSLTGESEKDEIAYAYKCRESEKNPAREITAAIPEIETRLTLIPEEGAAGYFKEGYAFSPMFTLGAKKMVKGEGAFKTWLKLEKES